MNDRATIERPPEFVSLREAAALLGVHRDTLRRRITIAGILTYQGSDLREVLVKRADLDRWRGVRPMPVPPIRGECRDSDAV